MRGQHGGGRERLPVACAVLGHDLPFGDDGERFVEGGVRRCAGALEVLRGGLVGRAVVRDVHLVDVVVELLGRFLEDGFALLLDGQRPIGHELVAAAENARGRGQHEGHHRHHDESFRGELPRHLGIELGRVVVDHEEPVEAWAGSATRRNRSRRWRGTRNPARRCDRSASARTGRPLPRNRTGRVRSHRGRWKPGSRHPMPAGARACRCAPRTRRAAPSNRPCGSPRPRWRGWTPARRGCARSRTW